MSKKKIFKILLANKDEMKRYGVRKIGVFGSYLRGTQTPGSDVDILVEFREKSFDNYMDLKFFLEKQFRTKVDLVLSDALKPRLKPLILKEVEYAKGL